MSALLPLFPLALVVFPGNAIPLHIFEERYREMVGTAEAEKTEFGIVLVKNGGLVNSGCTVQVERVVNRYPDGRFDVLTRGKRRFLIEAVNQDNACLRAEVDYFDDDDHSVVPGELRERVLRMFAQLPDGVDASADRLSFQIAAFLDDLDFKTVLQRSRSETDRLRLLADFLEAWLPRKVYESKMKHAAPTNGHGHKPAGL